MFISRNIEFEDEVFKYFLSYKENLEFKYYKTRLELCEINKIIIASLPDFVMKVQQIYEYSSPPSILTLVGMRDEKVGTFFVNKSFIPPKKGILSKITKN